MPTQGVCLCDEYRHSDNSVWQQLHQLGSNINIRNEIKKHMTVFKTHPILKELLTSY